MADHGPPAVVTFGDLFIDVVAQLRDGLRYGDDTPARITTHGGGAAANTAAWLADLQVPTAIVGRVGDDAWGRAAVEVLEAAGVVVHAAYDPSRPTGTCVVLVDADGQRTMVTDSGASAAIAVGDLPTALFVPGAHLHLSGFSFLHDRAREAALSALRLAAESGMTRSVDPGAAAVIDAVGADQLRGWLHGVDLLIPNEEEARRLAGDPDPIAAARSLVDGIGAVVVKLGADGAVWTDGRSSVHGAATAVPVLDTTGAGDSFAAGFLSRWLVDRDPSGSLAAGAAAAARCVTLVGGRPG